MTLRLTLPQQRARETRQRILQAASRVFARRGYGEATVDDVLLETGISRGAFYHHFAGKEQLFKALLDEHLSEGALELGAFGPVSSLRELIERFVAFQVHHLEADRDSGRLSIEFWAQATREDWARGPVAHFHRRSIGLIREMLRLGQSSQVIRPDLDVAAAAFLLQAVFEGTAVLLAVDPDCVDLHSLSRPWADLIEGFVKGDDDADIRKLQEQAAELFRQLARGQTDPRAAD